jgi:beta-1,4-mannosyltransferase
MCGSRRHVRERGPLDGRPLVVLESFGPPHGRNNPYFPLLVASFSPSVDVRFFSWRQALVGSFEVFHLHWPEVVMHGRTRTRSAVRSLLFVALLLRLKLQRKALVRTLHNLAPHEPVPWWKERIVALADRLTTVWITLSDRTPTPGSAPRVVAPHGHYRDWFSNVVPVDSTPGRLLFFGRIRRYKGLGQLLESFRDLDDPTLSLHVVGKSDDEELARQLAAAAHRDDRLVVTDEFVTDDVLAREIGWCEVAILPFVEMTNSGSLLLALSLDRPVLVPRLPTTEELADEVGPGWVMLYDGVLDEATLRAGVEAVRNAARPERPDLSGRSWSLIGGLHERAFGLARSLKG